MKTSDEFIEFAGSAKTLYCRYDHTYMVLLLFIIWDFKSFLSFLLFEIYAYDYLLSCPAGDTIDMPGNIAGMSCQ